ncbi:maleylpyruvate isomerase N-terminal domain-containing protein [Streptomyces sp. NPDC054864]
MWRCRRAWRVACQADAAAVLDSVVRLVESLDEREWSASTPCEAGDVRAVVDHLLDVQQRSSPI